MKLQPKEKEEQRAFIEWLEVMKMTGKVLLFTSIPNSTWTSSWSQKIKNKQQGLRRGFPDLVVVTKKKVLMIEMKRVKGTKPRPTQVEWLKALNKKKCLSTVAFGADQAIKFVEDNI